MIPKVKDTVHRFLEKTVGAEAVRVVSVAQTADGWIAEADVAEKNQYLASIHSNYRVIEKEHYVVRLNEKLEVVSYKRTEQSEDA
jgi:hypothetical protein